MGSRMIAFGLLVFSAFCSARAYGDGGIVRYMTVELPVAGREPAQSAQQAVLFWSDGVETLHVRSNYVGPKTGFAWVIPVPSRPTVTQSSWAAFEAAEKSTRPTLWVPHTVRVGGGCAGPGCSAASSGIEGQTSIEGTGVAVLESLEIKEFHVDVLSAREGGGLTRWLEQNGYEAPEKAVGVLQDYIEKGFCFVAVKFGQSEMSKLSKRKGGSVEAALTPLAITFNSPAPFFPLKISSISSAPENEMLLLVVTEQPVKPEEYPFVHLTQDDVDSVLRTNGFRLAVKKGAADFGPAVRIAQGRSSEAALVLEVRRFAEELDESARKTVFAEPCPVRAPLMPRCCVSRFHAFLKPQEMKDITFSPVPGGSSIRGDFYVQAPRSGPPSALACVPIGLAAVGAAGLAFSSLRRAGARMRIGSVLLIFLAACFS